MPSKAGIQAASPHQDQMAEAMRRGQTRARWDAEKPGRPETYAFKYVAGRLRQWGSVRREPGGMRGGRDA
jgi:hypothetical protein